MQSPYVKSIPLPLLTSEQTHFLTKLVNQILEIKESSSTANTSALEADIDRLVYEAYGLTEDEIEIVEGK